MDKFEYVSKLSMDRSNAWLKDAVWSKADYSNAFVGESGEVVEAVCDLLALVAKMSSAHGKVANAIKKLRRHETGLSQSKGPKTVEDALEAVKNEIGDAYIYLDLLAQVCGLKMYDCIKTTFNRVSEREGFPHRME